MTDFASLELSELLLKALEEEGYTSPTPIQAQAIPYLLQGHDVLGLAQTGTGKTAAFALPILNYMINNPKRVAPKTMRVLVLAPTRELASQIEEGFASYGRHMKFKHTVIFGGVGQNPQVRALHAGLDVLVATPGRLIDLLEQGHLSLSGVEVLVLDEADRMLDMGFIHAVRKISALVPKKRHTLLFSATMPDTVAQLAAGLLHNPKRVEVAPVSSTAERIDQKVMFVSKDNKRPALAALFDNPDLERAIIFTRTKHGANRVAEFLNKKGIASDAIHGNKSQNARVRALDAFRTGECRALVATDIAARGIDIDGISHVINFELPNEPESYVHRIGRTARAGRDGIAIALCDAEELAYLRDIEKLIQKEIDTFADHDFHAESLARVYRDGTGKFPKKTQGGRGQRDGNRDGGGRDGGRGRQGGDRNAASRGPNRGAPVRSARPRSDDNEWGDTVTESAPRKVSASAFRSENRQPSAPRAGEGRFAGDRRNAAENQHRNAGENQRRNAGDGETRPSRSGEVWVGGFSDRTPNRSSEGRPNRSGDARPARGGEGRPNRSEDNRPNRFGEGRPARGGEGRPNRSEDNRAGGEQQRSSGDRFHRSNSRPQPGSSEANQKAERPRGPSRPRQR